MAGGPETQGFWPQGWLQAISTQRQSFLGPGCPHIGTHVAARGIDSTLGLLGLQAGELLPSSALLVSWKESGHGGGRKFIAVSLLV